MDNKVYNNEINALIKELFYESWMDENDWKEFLDELSLKINYKKLNDEIEIGVKNGYSLEYQINLCKEYIKSVSN